jgi:hypothetical protein
MSAENHIQSDQNIVHGYEKIDTRHNKHKIGNIRLQIHEYIPDNTHIGKHTGNVEAEYPQDKIYYQLRHTTPPKL